VWGSRGQERRLRRGRCSWRPGKRRGGHGGRPVGAENWVTSCDRYSWTRPPSRSRRSTRMPAPERGGASASGGRWCRDRCGRWVLKCCTYSRSTTSRWRGPDARQALARAEQVALKPSRQMPTVLDRPPSFGAELLGPGQQGQVVGGGRAEGAFAELASGFVDCDDRAGAAVAAAPPNIPVPSGSVAGSGVDQSWAGSSTSTRRLHEPRSG